MIGDNFRYNFTVAALGIGIETSVGELLAFNPFFLKCGGKVWRIRRFEIRLVGRLLTPLKHSFCSESDDFDLTLELSRACLLTGSSSVSERLALLSELCGKKKNKWGET